MNSFKKYVDGLCTVFSSKENAETFFSLMMQDCSVGEAFHYVKQDIAFREEIRPEYRPILTTMAGHIRGIDLGALDKALLTKIDLDKPIRTRDEGKEQSMRLSHWAGFEHNIEALGMLHAAGADMNSRNHDGFTPLDMASFYDPSDEGLIAMAKALSGLDCHDGAISCVPYLRKLGGKTEYELITESACVRDLDTERRLTQLSSGHSGPKRF